MRECSPSTWKKRTGLPSSFARSSAGCIARLSAFQMIRRSFGHAMLAAVRCEAIDHLRVGPIEEIDAERNLPVRKRVGERDEEATLERADLRDRAG